MQTANAAVVPWAVVEGGPAHGVLALLHAPPRSGLLTQRDLAHDRRRQPTPAVSSWHPRHLAGDAQRDSRCTEDARWRHTAAPGQHRVQDVAQFSQTAG